MEDRIRISPEVSLAQTEGQEGKLVSTVPPCSGSSTSGPVSPCNIQGLTLQCVCRREKNRILSPLQYKRLPHCNTLGTKRKDSASLQLRADSKRVVAKVSHPLRVFSGTFTRATSIRPASALKPRFPHKAF